MTIGKEIKVVLTLDDAGFSAKSKVAKDVVKSLETGLNSFGKSVDGAEKGIAGLSNDMGKLNSTFSSIDKTLQTVVAAMEKTANKLDLVGSSATKSLTQLDRAQEKSARVAKETSDAFANSRIAALRSEIESDDKIVSHRADMYRKLKREESDYANQAMAKRLLLETSVGAVQDPGTKRFTSRAPIEADAARLESVATAAGIAALQADEAIKRIQAERQARLQNIEAIKQEVRAATEAANAKRLKGSIEDYVSSKNAEEVKRIKDMRLLADREVAAARQASDSETNRKVAAYQREEAAERRHAELMARQDAAESARLFAREQKAQAQQIAQMWKGIAQAYGGAKVGQGVHKAIDLADDMERQKVMVGALNLPKDEESGLIASSEAMAKNLQFLTTLDAVKSRMSAIASIGYNNADMIDKTLESAVKASNNLQYLGVSHGDMQSTIRNLYGVVEMRQQTGDADATNNTFETMQKIITGTAGKVQTQDMETVLRRLGMGASQLSDKGLINLAAIVDQFKVAGGDGGGAGGGVSTVGTAFKMMQAYSLGKGLSNEAVSQFAGAGVLGTGGLDLSKDSAGVLKDAKHAGFQNADLWLKDPVAAVQSIMPKIIAYTTKDSKNKDKFYQGRDTGDAENQMVAVSMYLARLGITTTASQALMVAGDPRSQHRIEKQAETISNSKGINEVDAAMRDTVGQDLTVVKSQLSDIGTLVGTSLLPPLKAVLGVFTEFLIAGKEWAKDNPITLGISSMASVLGGLVLTARGAIAMFGATGLTGIFSALTGSVGTAATAVTTSLTSWVVFKATVMGTLDWLGAIISKVPYVGAAFNWMGATLGKLAAGFGIANLGIASLGRIVSGVGALLMSWDFGQIIGTWLGGVKVGTETIGEHVQNLFMKIDTGLSAAMLLAKEKWVDFKRFMHLTSEEEHGAEKAEISAEMNALKKKRESLLINNDNSVDNAESRRLGNYKAPSVKEAEAGRKKALENADLDASGSDRKKLQAVVDAASGSGKRADHHADPLTKAIEQAAGKVESQKIKLDALKNDASGIASLEEEVGAEIEGKRKAGDYNKDQNKPVGKDDPRIKQLKEKTFQEKLLEEQIKATTFAHERVVASELESSSAMERLTGDNVNKQTDAFRALERELARAEVRLGAGAKGFNLWASEKAKALDAQARADGLNYSADLSDKTKSNDLSNIENDRVRRAAELELARETEQKKFDMLMETQRKTNEAKVSAVLSSIGSETQRNAKLLQLNEEFEMAQRLQIEKHSDFVKSQAEKDAKEMRTPLEKMAIQWKDSYQQLEDMQTSWASGFVSTITNAMSTGKLEIKDFLKSVMIDIAGAQMKTAIADPLKSVISTGTKAVGDALFGKKGADGASNGAPDQGDNEMAKLARQAAEATVALGDFVSDGTSRAIESLVESAIVDTESAVATSVASVSVDLLAAATEVAVVALWQFATALEVSAVTSAFADGGIMTNDGPVSLRKYANGGIANSPQLALYGEAGPEAYVPLPDGRSIPVTMSGSLGVDGGGGGDQNISISVVVNQDGSDSTSSSNDTSGAWSKVADKIKGVVREELIGQQRPGGLLYK
jgi:hypothetical protein